MIRREDRSWARVFDPPAWLIFVGAFVLLLLTMDRQIEIYDEGFMLTAAMRIAAGDMVHRDFYYLYGPANPWLLAKLWQAFTPTVLIGRVYGLAVQAGIVAGCYHMLRPATAVPTRWLCCLAVLLWMAAFQNQLYPSFPCILLFVIAAIVLLRRDPLRPARSSLVVAGVCAGSASLFRYDAGVAIMAAQGAYLLLLPKLADGGNVSVAVTCRRLALLCAGFAGVVAPSIIVYWQAGAGPAWWQDVISAATTFYVSHRGLPFPSLAAVARRPSLGGVYLPVVALVVGAATWRSRPPADGSAVRRADTVAAGLLMSCLAAGMYYKGVVRAQPLHFVMSIVPATLLLAICADALRRRRGAGRAATIALALLVIVPPAHAIGSALKRSTAAPGRTMADWLWRGRIVPPAMIADDDMARRLAAIRMDQGQVTAAAFVRARSCADERVFVAATRHDLFVVNNVALYFAMDRLPGTHWHSFDPGLQTRADIQGAMVRDLRRSDVRWIVRDASKDDIWEPNASSISSGVRVLDRWIAGNYHLVGQFPPATVWLRNGGSGGRPTRCPAPRRATR